MKRLRKRKWIASVTIAGMLGGQAVPALVAAQAPSPLTPIQHVILIIGENRTFDHVFATYRPPAGQTVFNLLSEGIVTADGTPGPNFAAAGQWQASDTTTFSNDPTKTSLFSVLPDINTDGAPETPEFSTVAQVAAVEPALEPQDDYLLTIGGTGQPGHQVDTRFPAGPANGPIPMDNYISYNDYASSPVHRFFQMWQQLDCNAANVTPTNNSGCLNDLFPLGRDHRRGRHQW